MTTNEMKAIYEANPDGWIIIMKVTYFWEIMYYPKWHYAKEMNYKLISIKHKDILEAYLADNSVIILEGRYTTGTGMYYSPMTDRDFIENYDPRLQYRLKEKEMSLGCLGEEIPKEKEDESNTKMAVHNRDDSSNNINNSKLHHAEFSTIESNKINNFQDYGFTGDFEGTVFFKDEDLHGVVLFGGSWYSCEWSKFTGSCLAIIDEEIQCEQFDLTPIKKEWYEYPENFKALVTRIENMERVFRSVIDKHEFQWLERDGGWRLATKAERDKLHVAEED